MELSKRSRFLTSIEKMIPILQLKRFELKDETVEALEVLKEKVEYRTIDSKDLMASIVKIYGNVIDAMVSDNLQLTSDESAIWLRFSEHVRMSDKICEDILSHEA